MLLRWVLIFSGYTKDQLSIRLVIDDDGQCCNVMIFIVLGLGVSVERVEVI